MVKRQRTPHFITGLGDGHVGRENINQQAQQRAGLRHPGLANNKIHSAGAEDDIFQVTKHTRRNNNNNNPRLRPATNERLVRMEMDQGRESRWDMIFTSSSSDGNAKDSGFANPMGSAEQWQMSAFALVGMIVFLSALFLHLVSDSAASSGSGSSYHNSHHHHNTSKFPRRSIARTKRKTSGTTRKKKFDDSDEGSEELSEASTSTPNGAPSGSNTKPVLFYPYHQPRHRKPSANGYKETYAGASYSPSGAKSTSNTAGFHSRNYYLAPMDGPVMMPSYHTPTSSSLKVRLSSPQPPYQNSPAQAATPQHQATTPSRLGEQQKNAATSTPVVGRSPAQQARPLATALDSQFVATGLESFQSDPPPGGNPQVDFQAQAQANHVTAPNMDNDEESQAQPPISEGSSLSQSTSNPPQSPSFSGVSPGILRRQISYTNTDNNYQAYSQVSWDNLDSNSNKNSDPMMNDSTHHMSNINNSNGNISSIGLSSPQLEIDFADLETPRAGLTRRTVDVSLQGGTPQRGVSRNPLLAAPKPQQQSRLDNNGNPNDPFYTLRLPSTQAMGMAPQQVNQQGAGAVLNVPFANSHQNQNSSPPGGDSQNNGIPLLPKLESTGVGSTTAYSASTGPSSIAAPRSIAVDELRLEQMEVGSVPHWQVRNPSPAIAAKPEPQVSSQKAVQPLGSSSDLFTQSTFSNPSEFGVESPVETNEARKSIKHKRPNITEFTDAASSLQSSIKFQELKLEEVIGGGGFGQVWRAFWRGTPVAVKVLTGSAQAKHVSKAILEEFAAEINLLSGMRHPNICLYMGACVDPPNRAIITELAANGSLWDALRLPLNPPYSASDGFSRHTWPGHLYHPGKHGTPPTSTGVTMPPVAPVGTWPWILVKHVACGAARGMAYLHSGTPPILHRDLKSANILLNESYTAKVCDFGLSRLKAQERSMTGNCGTVQWMAPEVLANQRYNEKADVFSYGIICTELLTRECPYEGMSAIQCALAVLNRDQRPEIPRFCPPQLRALIKACVKKNPDERPTFGQIIMALDATP